MSEPQAVRDKPAGAAATEAGRLAVLRDYAILDTPREAEFDELAHLAVHLAGTRFGAIGLVDADRVWFKAVVGLHLESAPREQSWCALVVQRAQPWIVPDRTAAPAPAEHPTATDSESWRFFAGFPLISPESAIVGVLCVMDAEPRTLTPEQQRALEILARQVIARLELRRARRRIEQHLADQRSRAADLQLAETRYRSLFESVGQGIFQTTADGRYLAANTALARIYGYDTSEELRTAVQDIRGQLYVEPGRRDEFIRLMREHGAVRHFESQVRRKDGKVIWISENARSVHDDHGHFLYYEGTVEDITDRKAAEEALRNSELLYHSLVESLPQSIFRKDREGRFTFVNQQFCQTLRRPAEHILGRTDAEFFSPELAAQYRADDLQVMTTGLPLEKTEEHVRPDGSRIYVHVIKTPLRDASGQIIGVQGIFWDETERHRMEEDLAYERDLLRALLDNVPDAIYFKDLQSRFIRASRSLAAKFGVNDPEKLRGKTDFHFFSAEHALPAYEDEQRIIRTGEPVLDKTEKETWPDGRVTWVRTSKLPYRNRSGRIIGTMGVSTDITDMIQVGEELARARDEALQAARLKAAILANLSHELHTPLNAIVGAADLLCYSPLNPEQREMARQIHASAETLRQVFKNILDQSRLEAGRVQLEQIEFNLRELVADVVEEQAEAASQRGLELVGWVHPDVPAVVRGDPLRLRQVLTNRVGNALQFTTHGEVIVRVGRLETRPESVTLRFEVEDTGVGITPEQLPHIFEPFHQADNSTTRQFGGTGLGLAICRELVQLMQGRIEVASTPGRGSTFAFTIPLAAAPAEARPPDPTPPVLRGWRALVVEDHATSRRVLLQMLRGWGLVTDEAEGVEPALHLLREASAAGTPFDVALVDLTLDGATGPELARAIQADPSLSPPPRVVLLTTLGQWLDAESMRAYGITACCLKPPRQARLFATLAALRAPAQFPPAHTESTIPPLEAPERPLCVLVAEDNEFNRLLAVKQLIRLGHQAHAVANGREVLRWLETHTADALLLDCQMPELDGYQTARKIRELEATRAGTPGAPPPLYIVALTAHAQPEDRERCLASGMNDYLTKPVRLPDLAAALNRGARSRGSGATAHAPGTPGLPVLDPTLQRTLAHAPEEWAELRALFIHTTRDQLARLRTAAEACDVAALSAITHTLKGSAENFGACRLARAVQTLEERARRGQVSDAAERVAALEAELEAVCRVLETTG